MLETLAGLRRDAPQPLMIDGMDPRELGLASLRANFALMPQDAPLVAGSVGDNLALARPGITREAMEQALWVACASDFVHALPDGLDQWLGGDGARLSGGQRRRIALTRALLAGRPWLMLDEPSEGLDAATEALLIDRLGPWLDQTGTGLILVSHRPAMMQLTNQTIAL
jgi:ATP-binding cassette subfamily C protein CydC